MTDLIERVEYVCQECSEAITGDNNTESCPECGTNNIKEHDRYFEAYEKEYEKD